MSKRIERNEIAEEGVLNNLLDPLKLLIGSLDEADKKLQSFADTVKNSVKSADDAKGMRELEQSTQAVNKAFTDKLEIDKQREKLAKDIEKAEAKLVLMQDEEYKQLQELKKAQREQNQSLKDGDDAYKKLSKSVRDAKNESKTLGAELLALEKSGLKNTEAYAKLAQTYEDVTKRAQEGDSELKKLDKTVGDNFRNVGNYESALNELNKTVAQGGMGYRDLRKMIKEYQDIAVKAGRTSPIGKQAIEDASKLQDELDTLQSQTKALADDGANMKAALQLGEVVASSYQSVLAVQQLLGVESERILEIMAKIQAVQVVINNLNKIRNSLDKASILTLKINNVLLRAQTFIMGAQATATTAATVATRALRVAMLSLPIVAIIAGVTALVMWYNKGAKATEDLKNKVDELNKSLEENRKELERKRNFENQRILIRNNDEILDQQAKLIQMERDLDVLKAKQPDNIKAIENAEKSLSNERFNLLLLQQKQEEKQFNEKIENLKEEFTIIENINQEIVEAIIKAGGVQTVEQDKMIRKNLEDMRKVQNEIVIMEEQRTIFAKKQENERAEFQKNASKQFLKTVEKTTKEVKKMQEADLSVLDDEEVKDVQKALDERLGVQEGFLQRDKDLRTKANAERITDAEEMAKAEKENEIKLIEDLIELRRDYGKDVTDLEAQLALMRQEFKMQDVDNTKEIFNELKQVAFDYYDYVANQAMQSYKNQEQAAQQMYSALAQMASTGNITAQESLAEQVKAQEEAQKAQMKIEQKKQKMQLISQGLNTFGSFIDAGDNPQVALGKTGVSMASLIGLINSLPSFFVGTEDTGKNGKGVDGKGGFVSILHPNERVMTAEQNAMTKGLSNPMLADVAWQYKTGNLVPKSYDGSFAVVSELVALRRAVEQQPKMITGLEQTLTGMVKLVVSEQRGSHKNTNIYKS
jgi:hypothetical protein